jgi:hypothetical protein
MDSGCEVEEDENKEEDEEVYDYNLLFCDLNWLLSASNDSYFNPLLFLTM